MQKYNQDLALKVQSVL